MRLGVEVGAHRLDDAGTSGEASVHLTELSFVIGLYMYMYVMSPNVSFCLSYSILVNVVT